MHDEQRLVERLRKVEALDETLWPEFQELNAVLVEHLHEVTRRVIAHAFSASDADVEERESQALWRSERHAAT